MEPVDVHPPDLLQLESPNPNPDTVFTDVLSFPFFLVTQLGKDVICLYEPKTIFKELV